MSAWYVMSAMGFYPVNPCGGEYELGVPLFPEMTIHLANGKDFTIKANKTEKHYNGVTLNGKAIEGTTIHHRDITAGGVLEFK